MKYHYISLISLLLLSLSFDGHAQSISYLWSTGDSTASIYPNPTSTTTYFVTTTYGSQVKVDSITIVVDNPQFNLYPDTIKSCPDSFTTLNAGNEWDNYYWSNGSNLHTAIVTNTGYYFATVTDSNGCSALDSIFVDFTDSTLPIINTQNGTVYLDNYGLATVTAAQLDNGTTDNCLLDSIYLNDYSFNCTDLGFNTIIFSAQDQSSNIASSNITVNVLDTLSPNIQVQNINVFLDAFGSTSVATYEVDSGTIDNCSIDSLQLSQTIFTCNDIGPNTILFSAIDNSGNQASSAVTVTVFDTIPPVILSQNIIAYLDQNGSLLISPSLIDNGSYDNCGLDSLFLDQDSFDCSEIGLNTVTLMGVDMSGNIGSSSAIIEIIDTVSPTIVTQTDTLYLDQNGIANVEISDIDGGSFDNCGVDSSYYYPKKFQCSFVNSLSSVYYTVSDASGNLSTTTANVFIADTLQPIIYGDSTIVYLDQTGSINLDPSLLSITVTDNCIVDSIWLDTSYLDCSVVNTYQTINFFAKDGSENIASKFIHILVLDTLPPAIAFLNSQIRYLDADGIATINVAEVDAGSADNCGILNQHLSQTTFNCTDQGVNELTYVILDQSGNISEAKIKVEILDTINTISGFTSINSSPSKVSRVYSVDSIPNASYSWNVEHGMINYQTGATAHVIWYNYDEGVIEVIQTTVNGCNDTLKQTIDLWPLGNSELINSSFDAIVFPNPTNDILYLSINKYNKASKYYAISIYDLAGKRVRSKEEVILITNEPYPIYTENLAKGMYFLILENDFGTVKLRFVLK